MFAREKLIYKKGQMVTLAAPVSWLHHTLPAGTTVRIDAVDRLFKTYDIVPVDHPDLWMLDVPQRDIIRANADSGRAV